MTSIYPKLPGNIITHDPTKVDFKKISATQYEKVLNNELKPKSFVNIPRLRTPEAVQLRDEKSSSFSQTVFTNPFNSNISEHFQPDWVKLDKQVLRFFGFFRESIVESKIEDSRVRKLTVYFYVTDGTMSIYEDRETNSGIIQGPFLRRGKIKKPENEQATIEDSYGSNFGLSAGKISTNAFNMTLTNKTSFYEFQDLTVGSDINVYGKWIRLFDCDDYTREFYAAQGLEQAPKQEILGDKFHDTIKNKFVPKRDNSMKDYLEHKLGGGKVHSQKQFLENDRKVLKFDAKYDGLNYIIHYFLADDTVEIREIHHNNSGRDPFPIFLKRRKLPRKFSISQPGNISESDFYKETDIEPNMTLWAFNRPFKILGCDPFTSQHYLENFGKIFPIGGFDEVVDTNKNKRTIPPYNGWGNEEDSIGNCLRLIPKQPKKDFYKFVDKDTVILRFLANLNSKVPEDLDRKFLISYFLSDDTVKIYEMPKKNSGIWEGKLLERGKYRNAENNNEVFNVSDFEINKSIKINSFSFYLLDADEFTKKWLSDNLK